MKKKTNGITHHEKCYLEHHDCAIERIRRAIRFVGHKCYHMPAEEVRELLLILKGLQ